MRKILSVIAVGLMVSACAQNGAGGGGDLFSKQNIGTVAGGAAGAILGSNIGKGKGQIASVAIGTLLGAGLGSSIGQSLDRADQMYHTRTAQTAFETQRSGVASTWSNPDSGASGSVVPLNVTQNASGEHCREYRQTINVGGQSHEGYGTACRQPDGSWRIVN